MSQNQRPWMSSKGEYTPFAFCIKTGTIILYLLYSLYLSVQTYGRLRRPKNKQMIY